MKGAGGFKFFVFALGTRRRFSHGTMGERRNQEVSWVGLGLASLGFIIEGVELSFQFLKEQSHWVWKEGRKYLLRKDKNHVQTFICL